MEISYPRALVQQIILGLTDPLNLHLIKLAGFEFPPDHRGHFRREVRTWLDKIQRLRIKPQHRTGSSKFYCDLLLDYPFGGVERVAVQRRPRRIAGGRPCPLHRRAGETRRHHRRNQRRRRQSAPRRAEQVVRDRRGPSPGGLSAYPITRDGRRQWRKGENRLWPRPRAGTARPGNSLAGRRAMTDDPPRVLVFRRRARHGPELYLRSGIFLAPFHNHDENPRPCRWSGISSHSNISTGSRIITRRGSASDHSGRLRN